MSSQLWHRVRWLLGGAFALLVVLLTAGAGYQVWAEHVEAGRFPPPGTLVDIGGRRLHLICIGAARPSAPAVIFESSEFGGALSSELTRKEIAAHTRLLVRSRWHGMERSRPTGDAHRRSRERP